MIVMLAPPTGWAMLVYWKHKARDAAGDRMWLCRRIPGLVSTFKYGDRGKRFLFLTSVWAPGLSVWLIRGIKRYPAFLSIWGWSRSRSSSIWGWSGISSISVYIANLTLDLEKLPNWPSVTGELTLRQNWIFLRQNYSSEEDLLSIKSMKLRFLIFQSFHRNVFAFSRYFVKELFLGLNQRQFPLNFSLSREII